MRHRKRGRRLGRTSSHRMALRRNLARNLFIHERIRTTREKAKEAAPFVEKLITLARESDSLANFRRALALLDDKPVVRRLFREIGPRFRERNGGYTRILSLSAVDNRLGDNASQVIFELVEQLPAEGKPAATEKKRSIGERIKQRIRGGRAEAAAAEAEPESAEAAAPEEAAGEESATGQDDTSGAADSGEGQSGEGEGNADSSAKAEGGEGKSD